MAKAAGQDRVSVLEFGVAGGNGLVAAEFHAKEIAKKFAIKIELYGFDSGTGLPEFPEVTEACDRFRPGQFAPTIDLSKLKNSLESAELIIGDIRDTVKTFIQKYNPAPVGAIFVDVDLYLSTVPILQLLEGDEQFLQPVIPMYFDDITEDAEFQGGSLAIKEFNQRNHDRKISPEGMNYRSPISWKQKIKYCKILGHALKQSARVTSSTNVNRGLFTQALRLIY